MSQQTIPRRRAALFVLSGLTLVAGAAITYSRVKGELSETVLTITVSAVLAGVLIRTLADMVLRATEPIRVVAPSTVRSSRRRRLPFRRRDERYTSPRFFRTPPYFIDFEERYVVKRPELERVLSTIRRLSQGLVVIEGPPASGKSILMHSLEFELVGRRWLTPRRRRHLYTLALKAITSEDIGHIRSDLLRLPTRSIVLVDDVHLYMATFGSIAQQLRGRRLLLVYATRLLSNYPREQVAAIEDQKPDIYSVSASSVADEIISRYLQANGAEERGIPQVNHTYDPYKHDLWVLSTALEASTVADGIPTVSSQAMTQWLINNSLRLMRYGGRLTDRASILAPTAALYRFEVPIVRAFLLEQILVSVEDLEHLVTAGEILSRTDHLYTLHHSSLATLFVDALSTDEGIGLVPVTLRSRAREANLRWQDAAVLWHIQSADSRAIRTIVGVARSGVRGRELALALLKRLDGRCFVDAIDGDATDTETMGSFLELWSQLRRPLTPQMVRRLRDYAQRAPRQSARGWAWLCCNVIRLHRELAELFVDVLAELLPTESPAIIADIGTTLSYLSPDLATRALASSDRQAIVSSLRGERLPAEEFAKVFAKLVWVDPGFAMALDVSFLDVFAVSTATTLPMLLSRIAWGATQKSLSAWSKIVRLLH